MRSVAAFICLAVLMPGPVYAACGKPDIPVCAVQKGAFPGEADFDQCRKQMLVYKDAMEKHASCTKEAGSPQEGQSSEEELQATLAAFNRRARGE
jgi:hypothetical protein